MGSASGGSDEVSGSIPSDAGYGHIVIFGEVLPLIKVLEQGDVEEPEELIVLVIDAIPYPVARAVLTPVRAA